MISARIRRREAAGLCLTVALLLAGCEALDQGDLSARTTASQAGAACASCHAYPLRDLHHQYHLFNADTLRIVKNVNGRITCVDCHADAMASQTHLLLDSICVDALKPSGWSSFDEQTDFRKCLQSNPLGRVDTLRQHRPVPMPPRPGEVPILEEWMTGMAHMNGRVDVKFDIRVSDTLLYPGGAEWNADALTCSAVACHEHAGHYRWAIPSQGLPGMRGHEAH